MITSDVHVMSHVTAGACPILDDPRFGSVEFENETRPVGSVAIYSCDPPYTLIGQPERTCLDTSVWSGQAPTCECKTCQNVHLNFKF